MARPFSDYPLSYDPNQYPGWDRDPLPAAAKSAGAGGGNSTSATAARPLTGHPDDYSSHPFPSDFIYPRDPREPRPPVLPWYMSGYPSPSRYLFEHDPRFDFDNSAHPPPYSWSNAIAARSGYGGFGYGYGVGISDIGLGLHGGDLALDNEFDFQGHSGRRVRPPPIRHRKRRAHTADRQLEAQMVEEQQMADDAGIRVPGGQ